MFTPILFIGIGRDNHFFTLRRTYLHNIYDQNCRGKWEIINTEVRSEHLYNLSQNYSEAYVKAKEAEKNFGLALNVSEDKEIQLSEIRRRTQEEIEQQRRAVIEENETKVAATNEFLKAKWERWKHATILALSGIEFIKIEKLDGLSEKQKNALYRRGFRDGEGEFEDFFVNEAECEPRMVGGAFDGKKFSDVPRSYFDWLIFRSNLANLDPETLTEDGYFRGNKLIFVAEWLKENGNFQPLAESQYIGDVGQKLRLKVSVDSYRQIATRFGLSHFYKFLDENGNALIWWASRPSLPVNAREINLSFTIKAHSVHNEEKQTVITRAKIA